MEREPDPRLRPEYAQGELVTVTTVRNSAEAEMLRDMLLDEGIPSTIRTGRSLNPFEFAGAAPHDVLVRKSGYEVAYELVHARTPEPAPPGSRSGPEPGNLLAAILIVLGLVAMAIWLSGNL